MKIRRRYNPWHPQDIRKAGNQPSTLSAAFWRRGNQWGGECRLCGQIEGGGFKHFESKFSFESYTESATFV